MKTCKVKEGKIKKNLKNNEEEDNTRTNRYNTRIRRATD